MVVEIVHKHSLRTRRRLVPGSKECVFLYVLLLPFVLIFSRGAASAQTVTYNYDAATSTNGKGRLTSVSDDSGITKFFYDEMGRTKRTDRLVDGITYITQAGVDPAGRVNSVVYPDGDIVFYHYNGPFLDQVYKDSTVFYAQYAGFNALGQPATVTFGNNISTSYTYSNSGNSEG